MPDTSSPTQAAKATAHLARVRDNQRRSRARRKEYLVELEEKFRRCEQAGVEASAEMQQAARQVLEENARLRAFLREKGHSDQELDSFTVRTAVGNDDVSLDRVKTEESSSSSAVQGLESLLNTKRSIRSSSQTRTQSGSRSPSGSDVAVSKASVLASTVSGSVPAMLPSQPTQQQSNPSSTRPQAQGFLPSQQSRNSQPLRQQRSQSSSQASSVGRRHASNASDFLDEASPSSAAMAEYSNYITFATGMSDAVPSSHQSHQRMQAPQHNMAQMPLHPHHIDSRSFSGPPPGVPISPLFQIPPTYSPHPSEVASSSNLSPLAPGMYHPSPLHSSLPSPSTYRFESGADVSHMDDFSDLLLAPELQAQFIRGLNTPQNNATFGTIPHLPVHDGTSPTFDRASGNAVEWADAHERVRHGQTHEQWASDQSQMRPRQDENARYRGNPTWQRW